MCTSNLEAIEAKFSNTNPAVVMVAGEEIKEDIFQDEEIDWRLIEIDDFINDLFVWIGGADKESTGCILMKQDLFMLNGWEDQYVWSSILTNKFVSPTLHTERFNDICEQVLKANCSE